MEATTVFKLCELDPQSEEEVWTRVAATYLRRGAIVACADAPDDAEVLFEDAVCVLRLVDPAPPVAAVDVVGAAAAANADVGGDGVPDDSASGGEGAGAAAAAADVPAAMGGVKLSAVLAGAVVGGVDAPDSLPARVTAFAWGRGDYGLLGNGTLLTRAVPTRVLFGYDLGLLRIRQVACSWYHCAAVSDIGLLFTWGNGADGALGHGDLSTLLQPALVEHFGLDNALTVRAVAVGADVLGSHTLAIASDGGLYAWGVGVALGSGTSTSSNVPTRVDDAEMQVRVRRRAPRPPVPGMCGGARRTGGALRRPRGRRVRRRVLPRCHQVRRGVLVGPVHERAAG